MKNFKKVLSKTFEKGLSKRFETFSKVEGYAKHTPTLRKPKFRFSNDGYGAPYPDTPSRGVTREGYAKHTLYLIKRGVAKTLGKFYQTTGMRSIPEHRIKRGVAL